jgi:hypothetical protein
MRKRKERTYGKVWKMLERTMRILELKLKFGVDRISKFVLT